MTVERGCAAVGLDEEARRLRGCVMRVPAWVGLPAGRRRTRRSLGAGYGGVLLGVDPPLLQTAEYARLGVALDRNADGGMGQGHGRASEAQAVLFEKARGAPPT